MFDISTLQAMAGRFLTASDLFAWEAGSQRRCTDLVRAFQHKALDPTGLHAALASERIGPAPPSSSGGLAVIGLSGVLMPSTSIFSLLGFGTSVRTFMQQLTAAAVDRSIKAIAVIVDSPGGSIRLVSEAAAAMRDARRRKPVVASVAGLAASASYWIVSNATAIESTSSGSVGAIGIIAERISIARQLEQQGVDVHLATAGKFKREGHEATAITPAEQRALQDRVDLAYKVFVNDVAAGRHVAASTVRGGYGEGRLLDAPDALKAGMIDRLATVEDTLARTLTSPAALAAMMAERVDQLRSSTDRARLDRARTEIAAHRTRIHRGATQSA